MLFDEAIRKAQSIGGNVPMGKLSTPESMKANSDCEDIDARFAIVGFQVESQVDIEATPASR